MSTQTKEVSERLSNIESILAFQKPVLNMQEVCQFTGKSRSHIYKLTSLRGIPHYKQGKHLYFDRKEIESWLKAFRVTPQAEIEQKAIEYTTLNRKGA